ncbi:MAG: hypothetical protein MUO58_17005 [Anaerolineales bacterium]|nr:hypothetical protein [Anaerolineales bacterium]
MLSAVKTKDLDNWHRVLALSACVALPLATIEADLHLLLAVVTAMPCPSRTYHRPLHLGLVSGGQFPNVL